MGLESSGISFSPMNDSLMFWVLYYDLAFSFHNKGILLG
jgi:hypothetical protein